MDQLEERYLKNLIKQLEDIAKSLRITSNRETIGEEAVNNKSNSYAAQYFSRSMNEKK